MDLRIEKMTFAGRILGDVLENLTKTVEPGISEIELDALAEKLITQKGGEPGFKKVPGYNHTICVSTNDVVVHGIPTDRKLNEGDILGIDCGVYFDGFHTDMAESVIVGKAKDPKVKKFLEIGKKSLFNAIKQAKPGNHVGHISWEMQNLIEGNGFSIVRSLVGHGVGKQLHEPPEIPGFVMGSIAKTPLLKVGMTVAIEVIYNMGDREVMYSKDDDWTIRTRDGSLSGLFERTILISKDGPKLLTKFSDDIL